MKVSIGVLGHVIVEHNVHSLDIHTTSKEVGGDEDTFMEILELLVSVQSIKENENVEYSESCLFTVSWTLD